MNARESIWTWPLLLLALVVPVSVGASSVAMGVVVAAALARALSDRESANAIARPVGALLLAVLVWHAFATLGGAEPKPRKLVDEWWIDLLLVAVPILAWDRPRALRTAVTLLLALGSAVAIYGVVQYFTGVDLVRDRLTNHISPDRHMAYGFFDHHLTYGGHVLVLWTLALAAALHRGRPRTLGALSVYVALALTSLGLLLSFARSAQIGAVVAAAVLCLGLSRRSRAIAAVGAIAGLGVALSLPLVRARVLETFGPGAEETRWNLWRSSWQGILDRPLLGWGPGNFGPMMQAHEVEGFYDTRAHAHNDWLMHAVDAGLPGMVLCVALAVTLGVWLWRRRHRAGDLVWIPAAAAALQAGFAVAGLFQVYQTDDEVEFALLLVTGAGLALVAGEGAEESARPDEA